MVQGRSLLQLAHGVSVRILVVIEPLVEMLRFIIRLFDGQFPGLQGPVFIGYGLGRQVALQFQFVQLWQSRLLVLVVTIAPMGLQWHGLMVVMVGLQGLCMMRIIEGHAQSINMITATQGHAHAQAEATGIVTLQDAIVNVDDALAGPHGTPFVEQLPPPLDKAQVVQHADSNHGHQQACDHRTHHSNNVGGAGDLALAHGQELPPRTHLIPPDVAADLLPIHSQDTGVSVRGGRGQLIGTGFGGVQGIHYMLLSYVGSQSGHSVVRGGHSGCLIRQLLVVGFLGQSSHSTTGCVLHARIDSLEVAGYQSPEPQQRAVALQRVVPEVELLQLIHRELSRVQGLQAVALHVDLKDVGVSLEQAHRYVAQLGIVVQVERL